MDNLLLAEFVDLTKFYPLGIFGLISVVAWMLLEKFGSEKPRAEQRLDEFKDPTRRLLKSEKGESLKKSDAMTRVLEKASPTLSKPLLPKSDKEAASLKSRLSYAGFRSETAPSIFLGLKFIGLILGFLISAVIARRL